MSSPWIQRAARLLLAGMAIGYLFLMAPSSDSFGTPDLVIGLGSALLMLAGGRFPLTAAVGQALLLGLAEQLSDASPVTVKVAASLALLELAIRRLGLPTIVGFGALALAYVLGSPTSSVPGTGPLLYRMAVTVAGPVLLGGYIRALQRMSAQKQDELEMRAQNTRWSERAAIARELHDMGAHHMASLALRAGVARHVLAGIDARVDEVFEDVHTGATNALNELRAFLVVLRDKDRSAIPFVEPADLQTAIDDLIEQSRASGLHLDADIDATLTDPATAGLDPIRANTILRLAQEGLTNVLQHAGTGARARLTIHGDERATTLVVRDNGPGRRTRWSNSGGLGLLGLRERVELVGGNLHAGPDGQGWVLSACLPSRQRVGA